MSIFITIEGDGLSLKKQTSLKKAGQIISFLGTEQDQFGAEATEQPLLNPAMTAVNTGSVQDLINEYKAKTNPQKITIIGSYLAKNDQTEGFLAKEVLLQLKKMGEEPGNFARDLKMTLNLQYIYEISQKDGKFGVSDKGLAAINSKFSIEQKKLNIKKKTPHIKISPPRKEIIALTMVATLNDFPGFHELPKKSDSILWTLAYGDSNGFSDLTSKEIEIMTDKLRGKVLQKSFSSLNNQNIKNGYVSQTNGKFKIQEKGLSHLRSLIKTKNV